MRKTLGIAALMLALCCHALAGEIPNPPAAQPQGMTTEEPILTDESLTQVALDVALSVLSLP